jgi:DNA-binding NarL/FixJ family response regulator
MPMASKILIVDDHPLMRAGLTELISGEADIELCGQADDAASAMQAIETLAPDIVVLDLTLGRDDGVALVTSIHSRWPSLAILVLSMHDEALYAERLLTLGARGYVMKQEAAEVFLAALRRIIGGELYVSPALASRLYARLSRAREPGTQVDSLTERERQVMREVARGKGTQEIAAALGMSAKTVDSHRRNIREKLGLATPGDLVRYALQWESLSAPPAEKA